MTGPESSDGRVFFPGDHLLEGMLEWPEADPSVADGTRVKGGVVIAHPYPPNGATMAQPVVYRIARSSQRRGLATLRFNFRGVGGSLGAFSGTEEHRDVEAAAAFLSSALAAADSGPEVGGSEADRSAVGGSEADNTEAHDTETGRRALPLALAGYSFGSVMAARAAAGVVPVQALALVGFVVSWENTPPDTFTKLAEYRGPVLAVCAENDDLGYPEDVERVLTDLGLDFRLSVVEGAGHFLEGRHREVGETVASFLAEVLVSDR